MIPAIIATARHQSAGDENLIESLANLRMLTNYIWGFLRTYGGPNLASLPEVERRELLIEVREMNGFVRTISSGLERVSVRSVLLKFASAKTVIGFQEAAERYDDFLESLELSLNEDLLAMVMADPTPHLRETENAV